MVKIKKPTLKDIAKAAGVTAATVSLVMKDAETKRVSPAKRKEILDTAKKLNYRTNQIARALVTRKSSTIGLVVNTLVIPFYSEIAQDILSRAKETGYRVLISSTLELRKSNNPTSPEEEREVINNLLDYGVDGLIICSARREDPVISELQTSGIPFILALRDVNRGVSEGTYDYIGIDNELGGYMVTKHLLKLGYKNIVIITGDMQVSSAHERLAGTLKAFHESGIEPKKESIFEGDYKRETSYKLTCEIIKNRNLPDAIISQSDHMAMGVLTALRDNGIKVPNEVAVVGFDDIEMAGLPGVDLTTISQEKEIIGKTAVDMLVDKLKVKSEHISKRIILKPKLVVRKTCGFK